ncbi:MAG: endopeptidase La [Mangrovibacterium sp.]
MILHGNSEDGEEFIPIIADGDDHELQNFEAPDSLPILSLRNAVLFPGVVLPITVGRSKSLKLVSDAWTGDKLLGTLTQIDAAIDDPQENDLFKVGTVAQILKVLEMPDGTTSVIIQGKRRFEVEEFIAEKPYFKAKVNFLEEYTGDVDSDEFNAIVGSLKDLSIKIAKHSSSMPPEAGFAVKNIENSTFLINFICANTDLEVQQKQQLLEEGNLRERGIQAISHLVKEVQRLELKNDIQSKVKKELDQQQREFFLNQQMKAIQDELGTNPVEKELAKLKEEAARKKWNESVAEHFNTELEKLSRLNPMVAEYSVQLNYCQTLLDLPWGEYTKDNFDLKHATEVLDEDHYGLEKVKERILEHLAVLKLKDDMKSPIICLHGPPGVGKTSLGKSIARALDRKYIRMSLGGLHDESEIRGHRKTYIGAMPGRIIQNLKKAKASNPVFILDELDKISRNYHGDPASALLEVLDPEQNSTFHDNYLEIEYDLSKVMFVATANSLETISPPLRDRLEIIDVTGYILEEKREIAKCHLIPKQLANHGLAAEHLHIADELIELIIEKYTRESGVRTLDKKLAKLIRRVAKKIAFNEKYNVELTMSDLMEYLGVFEYSREIYQGNDIVGVVTGLAWTAVGGEILFIESSQSKGKGTLSLTGNLGDVMKESAQLALQYIKGHTQEIGVDEAIFDEYQWHVHVPAGAIPKDGPSAGITMVTSLVSTMTKRKLRANLAMTGEITLRGRVLPVGGIKEKVLAAKRAGITDIILSVENEKDIEEINDIYLEGLSFHFVRTIDEVLKKALL